MSGRRHPLLISLAAFILTSVLLYQGYHYRCVVFTCEPLTWPEMQALARTYAAKAGSGYRLEAVFVDPAYREISTTAVPETLEVRMKFVSPKASTIMPDQSMYPVRTIAFETQEQVIRWQGEGEETSEQPSPESLQRLDRVRIGPSDVYRLTWERAQQDLSGSANLRSTMLLSFRDKQPTPSEPESSWFIIYFGDSNTVFYRVDAQTGVIFDQYKP